MKSQSFLEHVFPDFDENAIRDFSEHMDNFIKNGRKKLGIEEDVNDLSKEISEKDEEIETLRKEIARLNTVIVNQRAAEGAMSPAALGILAERARQQRIEGYNETHDDEHLCGQLVKAAACFLLDAIDRDAGGTGHIRPPSMWPWESKHWKQKPVYRQFEIAGALIIAEQERRKRNGLDSV